MKKHILLCMAFLLCITAIHLKAQIPIPKGRFQYGFSCTDFHRNANCPEAKPYYEQRNATVHISFFPINADSNTMSTNSCSGTLIVNSPPGGNIEYYVLSAAHCLDPPTDYSTTNILFTFNFQYPTCNARATPTMQNTVNQYLRFTSGGSVAAIGAYQGTGDWANDWVLFRINEDLTPYIDSDQASICFSCIHAFQNANDLPMEAFSFHHPRGDVKKFTLDTNFSQDSDNRNMNNVFYDVAPDTGLYEPGSSGCGLFADIPGYGSRCLIGILSTYKTLGTSREECEELRYATQYRFVRISNALIQAAGWQNLIPSPLTQNFGSSICFDDGKNCFNNVKDSLETSVDCGGNCPSCEEHCYNGKRDAGEGDVDCGGKDCKPCHCFNGKRDEDEEKIDCGGKTCPPCRRPVSNEEDDFACKVVFSGFSLLNDCYNGSNRFPQVNFRLNSNCLGNLCLKWVKTGETQPTTDINPVPVEQYIGERGQVKDYTYTWDFHGGEPPFPYTQTYDLVVYDFSCTQEYARTSFPITIYNGATVSAGSDFSMCLGQSERLNGSYSGGNYYVNVRWTAVPASGLAFLSDQRALNPTLTPTLLGTFTYTLEASDAMGCSGSDVVVVKVDTVLRPAVLQLCQPVNTGLHQAGKIFAAGQCSVTVAAVQPTDFWGGTEVNLLPGFTATPGTHFTARISPCPEEILPDNLGRFEQFGENPVPKTSQKNSSFSVEVFPNPTEGRFTVRYVSDEGQTVHLLLTDGLGKKLMQKTWNESLYDLDLDLNPLPGGLYYLSIYSGKEISVQKVLKK